MKAKEALVQKSAFPNPLANLGPEPFIYPGIAHTRVTIESVRFAPMTQAIACNILLEKRRETRFLGWSDHIESLVYLTV